MLKPPTTEQEDTYDVCEADGDLFHVADGELVQCQMTGDELYIHNIEIDESRRRTGVARGILSEIRTAYPGVRIVANGVEWMEPAGRFWKAMVEGGLVDAVVTYEHGEITRDNVEAYDEPSSPSA
jgi:hypothetical protein